MVFMITLSILLTITTILKELNYFSKKNLSGFWITLIPKWSFFAPTPCVHDYHLLFRYKSEDNTVSDWQIAYQTKKRSPFSFIWNPEKKRNKGFLDAILNLLALCDQLENIKQICICIPYLILLDKVDSMCQNPKMKQVQFIILTQSIDSGYQTSFISELHPISKK